MKMKKQSARSILSLLLVLLLTVSFFPLYASADTDTEGSGASSVTDTPGPSGTYPDCPDEPTSESDVSSGSDSSGGDTVDTPEPEDEGKRIQAGYAFAGKDSLTVDVGGKYPLSTKTFGSATLSAVTGYREGGMSGYVSLDNTLFTKREQLSLGFWTKFSLESARSKGTLLRVNGKDGESVNLGFTTQGKTVSLRLTVNDGKREVSCNYDVTEILTAEEAWSHFAFTYRKATDSVSQLVLYVNGKFIATSQTTSFVDLSQMKASSAALQGVVADELYITNFALESAKISSMMNQPIATFYATEQKEIEGGGSSGDSGSETPGGDEKPPVTAFVYPWAGYFFEGSYNAGADSGSSNVSAMVDNDCVRIDSANLVEKFGHGIVRREGSAPAYYLKMDSRLVQAQNSFSFACWVFRSGDSKANEECLLELGGSEGILRFAPYAVGADGVSVAYVEYTDSRGNIQHGMIPSNASSAATGAWVHYTLTVAYNGTITVYVNGVASAVFASGVSPAALNYEDCRVVTGASSSDPTRTVIDEVYFAPQVLSAAEVRKIHYYGLQRYTTEVLPDPGSGGGGVGPGVLAPDDTDISEDAYNKIGAIANGFIGTTFDDRVAVGRDWNNSADATVTGERLTTGISSYALSMDGSSSFLRYPMGILDGVTSFTVSLSYSWAGTTSATTRSQRLFDFSRKASSVSEPTAYIYLETGLGFGGLKFGMSDGINSTFLTYDYNETNTWTRVTVTVANGTATLYVNDQAVDSVATNVSVSSICPNFCYVGRSGVKGDPLFKGAVDEIYISNTALSENEVGKWMKGISAAINGEDLNEDDGWSTMIVVIIVVAVLLVIGVVVTVVLMITKREKKPKAEIPLMPSPRPGMNNASEPVLGPRSARRARMEAEGAESEATMKFRKVKDDTAVSVPDPSATTEFRKVTPDEPAEGETAVFRKIDTDNSDSTK